MYNETELEGYDILRTSMNRLITVYKSNNFTSNNQVEEQMANNKTENDLFSQNFCNEECLKKFKQTLEKLKNNQIDITKIQAQIPDLNIIQNLLNYYYELGFNQGYTESIIHKNDASDSNLQN